ncbi:flagellar export protein FliJ [Thermoclostridium stercorarium]|uniref:flagellar export protein FliJ n=1 Tax=Thermoclostridium stercorarium TaxID=1510 RepID=UPI002248BEE2|nr:flagellar export protein FliJ [Thermoclostridium stercorarium]UZQ86171.1 flagellar export protein FliJ [Thermoclostridium stercorarium]
MARFSFRLQPFLNLKEMMEKNIKNELGIAVQKYQQQLLVLSEIREEIDIQQQEFRKEGISLTTPLKLRQRMEYIKVVQNREKVQIERVNEEKRNVDKIRKRLMETMKEKRSLKSLKKGNWMSLKRNRRKSSNCLLMKLLVLKKL